MLQSIREKTSGWIAGIILGAVILTMAFFGIESYVGGKVETYAAKIEGPARFLGFGGQQKVIEVNDFRQRFDRVRAAMREEKGEAFDAADFESMQSKREVLDQLVDEALLDLVAEKEGVKVAPATLAKAIMERPEFQVGGKFDVNQYRLVLSSQQMTPRQFEALVGADVARQALPQQLLESGISSDAEIQAYLRSTRQTRDVRLLELQPSMPGLALPSEAQIKAWYDAHPAQYRSPERVAVEYAEVNAAAIPVTTVADEGALRERYESVKSRFGTLEQRLASHILVRLDEKATPAQVAAAEAKARDLAAKARAAGADFAAIARASSDDLGSRDAGGDLGPVEKGSFGDAFDKAFFALQPGQVSDPVRLPDGFHVIWFRQLVAGSAKPFEQVRPELEAEYLETERERLYNDLLGKLTDRIYQSPTALKPAAKELGLRLQRSAPFSRTAGDGIAALPKVREAAFQDAQKNGRQTSDPIEVEPNHSVVLRVVEVQPAAALPLASVRDRIIGDIIGDQVAKASKAQADAVVARIAKGEPLDAVATSLGLKINDLPAIPRQAPNPQLSPMVDAAFRLPRPVAGKAPPATAVKLPDGRYLVVAVTAVTDGDPSKMDAALREQLRSQIGKARGLVEARAFLRNLRKQYKVTVAEDRL
jgi:peptidyl-prolyl cis-trans isomerase D